jgi:hypothetical protein
MRRIRRGVLAAAVAALMLATTAASASAAVPNPTVEGPIQGGMQGRPHNHTLFSLRGRGYDYTEHEYFYSGTATNLTSGVSAPYESRMLVRLPRDPRKFSGLVQVEWLNVTGQEDFETSWPVEAQYLMRHGVGYVGVSAQLAGICCSNRSLKIWDPQRYGPLLHPSDNFSYDIFSQAIEALRDPAHNGTSGGRRVDPMRGLRVRHVVANGASQSASRLTTFINDHYNRGGIDLFLITRGGGPYTDFSVPIFNLNEENNPVDQPDSRRLVGWEEAGTAHAPAVWWNYITAMNRRDHNESVDPIGVACSVNRGSVDYSTRAMSYWVERYFQDGSLAPSAPRMKRDATGNLVRDRNGLAEGGLRHPFVQVPVSFNSSEGCPLYGTYRAWSNAKIRSLYRSHCDYVTRVSNWSRYEVSRGWLLREDRVDAIDRAVLFRRPWPRESLAGCRAAAFGTGCLSDSGPARGKHLGPAVVGRTRARQRRALRGARLRSRRHGIDRYCVFGGGSLRIAYPTRRLRRQLSRPLRRRIARRAVLILTSSRHFSVRGIRRGARVRTLRRRLRHERRVRVGRNVWYVARGRRVRVVYKTRGGLVREVGIASRRLTRGRRAQKRFLRSWRL